MSNRTENYILLERDGVINRRIVEGYVSSWSQFEFLPRVHEALRLLAENGFTALVVSDQECVGTGMLSLHELQDITSRFLLEVALEGGNIGKVYYCTHTANDGCDCRKPMPGMLQRAMAEHALCPADTYMIGESPRDLEAAARAGCPSILIRRAASLWAQLHDWAKTTGSIKRGLQAYPGDPDLGRALDEVVAEARGSPV